MRQRSSFLEAAMLVIAVSGMLSLEARDEEELARAPKIDAAYIAPAYMRSFFLDVQAIEPRWLYEKQIENWFPLQSCAFNIAHVVNTPVAVPTNIKSRMSETMTLGRKGAKEELEKGPMLGADRVYVIFDSNRKPQLIVFRQAGFLVTHHAHDVSEGDMFQAAGKWRSVSDDKELMQFLESIDLPADDSKRRDRLYSPVTRPETPFLKWSLKNEEKSDQQTKK